MWSATKVGQQKWMQTSFPKLAECYENKAGASVKSRNGKTNEWDTVGMHDFCMPVYWISILYAYVCICTQPS